MPLNESHLRELIFEYVHPPIVSEKNVESALIRMGFPRRREDLKWSLCACHQKLINNAWICPGCCASVCAIPSDCPICNLTLVSSPRLARTYHHLFPIENFKEFNATTLKPS